MTNSVWSTDTRKERIHDILFRNIALVGKPGLEIPPEPSRLEGLDAAHGIENVRFENVTMLGRAARTAEECRLDVRDYVKNVTFSADETMRPIRHIASTLELSPFECDERGRWHGEARVTLKNESDQRVSGDVWLNVAPANMADTRKRLDWILEPGETYEKVYPLTLQAGRYLISVGSSGVEVDGAWRFVELDGDARGFECDFVNYYGECPGTMRLSVRDSALVLAGDVTRESRYSFTLYAARAAAVRQGEVLFTAEETDFGECNAVVWGAHGEELAPQVRCPGEITYVFKNQPAVGEIRAMTFEGGQEEICVPLGELPAGEGAENGIAASREGAVILTNQNCYLLRANSGVELVWKTSYESAGAKVSGENDKTTGGGLAWGSGCSPTLTPNLVMFTDNQETVNLLALDMKTGEVVASHPVLDDLPEGYQVAVENSAIVYDDGEGTVSTIVCNWFGAGSAGLANPDSDSSIQSYANIYDMNWLTRGNSMIAPGVERVDTIKTETGYEMKSVWSRNDLSDTSILKLSTATGYVYGYVQDLATGMWQYIILDFETGETVFTMDVSNKYGYNNMAIGMYAGNSGNALYCPTGYLELLRLQDRFVYRPEMPYRQIDLDQTARNVLTQEKFTADGGEGNAASWLNTVSVRSVHPNTTVAFRMNNLSGSAAELKLYAYGADGKLAQVAPELWSITNENGEQAAELTDGELYEVRVTVVDNDVLDLNEAQKEIKLSVVLGK